jgi:hypothetical protein
MRWLAALVVVAGCDRFLNLDEVKYVPPDAPPPPCAMPPVSDTFEDPSMICGSWGLVDDTLHWLSRSGGSLVITPAANTEGYAACEAKAAFAFDDNGLFVHVSQPGSDQSYGILEAYTYTNAGDPMFSADTTLAFSDGQISLYDQTACTPTACPDFGHAPYVLGKMNWFRIHPTDRGATIVGEFSDAGLVWTQFARRPLVGAVAAYVQPAVAGGAGSSATTPVPVAFDSFDVCPDQPGN